MATRGTSSRLSERDWRRLSRREVLKLAPLGALASADVRDRIVRGGLALSDGAAESAFRPSHLASTYSEADLTPFERFPINSYSAFEPSNADLGKWRLYVEGLVSRPGASKLEQIAALPKVVQNVRHICIELAYTSTIAFGILAVVTGIVLSKPVQLSGVVERLGGFALVRLYHFAAMVIC